jgi:hypothetical protein
MAKPRRHLSWSVVQQVVRLAAMVADAIIRLVSELHPH